MNFFEKIFHPVSIPYAIFVPGSYAWMNGRNRLECAEELSECKYPGVIEYCTHLEIGRLSSKPRYYIVAIKGYKEKVRVDASKIRDFLNGEQIQEGSDISSYKNWVNDTDLCELPVYQGYGWCHRELDFKEVNEFSLKHEPIKGSFVIPSSWKN